MQRWNQRASVYANENDFHVREAFKQSRYVKEDEFLPFPRDLSVHYYHKAEGDIWFVVERQAEVSKVITILVPDDLGKNYLNSKFQKEPIKGYSSKIFEDLPKEEGWLRSRLSQLHSDLAYINKANPEDRAKIMEEVEAVKARMEEIKPMVKEMQRAKDKVIQQKKQDKIEMLENIINKLVEKDKENTKRIEALEEEVRALWQRRCLLPGNL
jgi:hypothetical protein